MLKSHHLALLPGLRSAIVNPLAAPLYVVTAVFVLAGAAKLIRPSATAAALRELSVPSPLSSARFLGLGEIILGVVAIATGNPLAWAGIALSYGAFTLFVLWALGDASRIASCGCFGREDTPATPGHLAFNAVASALAALAIFDPVRLGDFNGSAIEAILAIGLIAAAVALSIAGLTVLPRTCLLYTSPSPRDQRGSRMPSSA